MSHTHAHGPQGTRSCKYPLLVLGDTCSDIATEYTFSLELRDDTAHTKALIVTSVKNIMDPSKTYVTIDEALLQPWLDAFLGACGLHHHNHNNNNNTSSMRA